MENKEFITALLSQSHAADEIRKNMDKLLRAIPEIQAMVGFAHCHPHHHLDVWEHTLLALSLSENRILTRTALLLHDIGKPFCYQCDGEIKHYHGHAKKSEEMARLLLLRLNFDVSFVHAACALIRKHDTPMTQEDILKNPDFARDLFEVQRCDALAHNPIYNQKRMEYLEKIKGFMS